MSYELGGMSDGIYKILSKRKAIQKVPLFRLIKTK